MRVARPAPGECEWWEEERHVTREGRKAEASRLLINEPTQLGRETHLTADGCFEITSPVQHNGAYEARAAQQERCESVCPSAAGQLLCSP